MATSIEQAPADVFPSLSTLVSYLLAAKRSLNCADHLSRANDIVTATRNALAQQSATAARTRFLLSGCDAQLRVLGQLRIQLRSILKDTSGEFEQLTKGVETSEKGLNSILDGLRSTIVDSNLRPKDEEPKNLLDFVEGTGVQGLLDEIWAGVEEYQTARDNFTSMIAKFEQDLAGVDATISNCHTEADEMSSGSPLPGLLQSLESSAYEMAQNFESLVRHHDLCVNALRNTEGAGAALYQAQNNDLSDDQNAALAREIEAVDDSLSAEDHAHMLTLLSDDVHQVEEVIDDIRESLVDMQSSQVVALSHVGLVSEDYRRTVTAFSLLEAVGSRVMQYTTQSHLFVLRTDDEKARIAEKQMQLSELTRFYSGFLSAYDNLVIEVGRRKDLARRMKRAQEDALSKLEKLYQEDVEERELFRVNHGEFLPMDIWPGLLAPAPRYEIGLVEGSGSVPDISASVIQKAIRRVSARPDGE